MDILLIGIPFLSRRMMKLSEKEHDEHEQDIYEDNNGRNLCPGQARTVMEFSP